MFRKTETRWYELGTFFDSSFAVPIVYLELLHVLFSDKKKFS